MNKTFLLPLILSLFLVTTGGAQNVSLGRERLLAGDFSGAQSALAGASASNEVHILRAIAEAGTWFGTDVNTFLKSLGAKAEAVDRLTDLETALANGDTRWFLKENWMQGEARVLNSRTDGDYRIYEFPQDEEQESVLVLRNLTDEPMAVSLTANFASEHDEFNFYRSGEWWGSVDAYSFSQGWWNYQDWYDGSLEKSFSITLDPFERLTVLYEADHMVGESSSGPSLLSLLNNLIINGSLEVQNGQYDRYNAPRDPVNDFFNLDPTDVALEEDTGTWRVDGQIELMGEAAMPELHELDYWLSKTDVLSNPYDAKNLTFTYNGSALTQLDFTIYSSEMYDWWSDYEGSIYINGVEVGSFNRWGADWLNHEDIVDAADDDPFGMYGNDPYLLSLPLEPGDRLSLVVEGTGWGYYGTPNPGEEEPLVGLAFMDPVSGLSVQNGVAPKLHFPRFSPGTDSADLADALFASSGEFAAIMDRLIDHLERVSPAGVVLFSPEETGLLEEIRVEYADVQLILAGLKLARGVQLLASLQDDGQIPLQWSSFEPYLDNPVQFWEDHPNLLTLIQSRSGQALEAKVLFEAAVEHYRSIEDDLWTRGQGIGWRYLFRVISPDELSDPLYDGPTQSSVAADVSAFEASLEGEVAINVIKPESLETGAVSLAPFFDGSPPSLRSLIPAFDEWGFFQGGSGPMAESGFVFGYAPHDIDLMLFDAEWLMPDAVRSLAGKMLVGYRQQGWWPPSYSDFPSDFLYFSDAATVVVPEEGIGVETSYTWDPGEGDLRIMLGDGTKVAELEFDTGASGIYYAYDETYDEVYQYYRQENWRNGRFVLYDASFDLDGNGSADGADIQSGRLPEAYGINTFGDWDGDFLSDEEEDLYSTNPMLIDTDGDGLDDWEEVYVYETDPTDAASTVQPAPAAFPVGTYMIELDYEDDFEEYEIGDAFAQMRYMVDFRSDGSMAIGFRGRETWKSDWTYSVQDGLGVIETSDFFDGGTIEVEWTDLSRGIGMMRIIGTGYDQWQNEVEDYDYARFYKISGPLERDPDWTFVESFFSQNLDRDLWQRNFNPESEWLLNDGMLDFATTLGWGAQEAELECSKTLPFVEAWVLQTGLFNANPSGYPYAYLGLSFEGVDMSLGEVEVEVRMEGDVLWIFAFREGDTINEFDEFYSSATVSNHVELRIENDPTIPSFRVLYDEDGAENGWNWDTLLELDGANDLVYSRNQSTGVDLNSSSNDLTGFFDSLSAHGYMALEVEASAWFDEGDTGQTILQPIGLYHLSVFQPDTAKLVEEQGEISLYLDEDGYRIGESLLVTRNGRRVSLGETTILGVERYQAQAPQALSIRAAGATIESEPPASGFIAVVRTDGDLFQKWYLDENGAFLYEEELASGVDASEEELGQDLDGDALVGGLATLQFGLKPGWNQIAFPIAKPDMSVEAVLGAYLDQIEKIIGGGGNYTPGFAFNTLTEFQPGVGYWIKMKAATDIDMQGGLPDPQAAAPSLVAGWSHIGFFGTEPVALETALAPILDKVEKVIGDGGNYTPGFQFNTLTTLRPGVGYWIKMSEESMLYYE